jgi:hypothetical protein
MKNLIIILSIISVLLIGCVSKQYLSNVKLQDSLLVYKQDIVDLQTRISKSYTEIRQINDSLEILSSYCDSIKIYKDSLEIYRDSIKNISGSYQMNYDCFSARFKIAKIKRYVDITTARPSNQKFFFGWIKRTITTE